MSFSETIFLFVLALVVFGPKKLPEIARQIGKALNEFRRASNEFKAQIEHEIAHLEVESKKTLPPSPAPEGTTSRTVSAASSGTANTQASTVESTSTEATAAPATLAVSSEEPAKHVVEPATEALPVAENSDLAASNHVDSNHSEHPTSDLHDSQSVTQESHA